MRKLLAVVSCMWRSGVGSVVDAVHSPPIRRRSLESGGCRARPGEHHCGRRRSRRRARAGGVVGSRYARFERSSRGSTPATLEARIPQRTCPRNRSNRPRVFGQVQENIRKAEYNITLAGQVCNRRPTRRPPCHANTAPTTSVGLTIRRRRCSGLSSARRARPEWDVQWRFKKWGRDGNTRSVQPVKPHADEHTNRLTYGYDGIEEWFVNDERGLEHGFTVARRPAGDGPLVLTGVFGGTAQANNTANPNTIEFADGNGRALLQYCET